MTLIPLKQRARPAAQAFSELRSQRVRCAVLRSWAAHLVLRILTPGQTLGLCVHRWASSALRAQLLRECADALLIGLQPCEQVLCGIRVQHGHGSTVSFSSLPRDLLAASSFAAGAVGKAAVPLAVICAGVGGWVRQPTSGSVGQFGHILAVLCCRR
jgi:hypothetical protein